MNELIDAIAAALVVPAGRVDGGTVGWKVAGFERWFDGRTELGRQKCAATMQETRREIAVTIRKVIAASLKEST